MGEKLAIITGGSSGIGLAAIKKFHSEGWDVVNVSRRVCNIDNIVNIQLDLAIMEDVCKAKSRLVNSIKLSGSYRDVCLVHSAGYHIKDNIQDINITNTVESFNVNIIAPLILNTVFLDFMKEADRSSIIYIGSTLSEKAVKNSASYSISKHACIGMMKATTQDLAGLGIHTACICPGFTDTNMLKQHLSKHVIEEVTSNVCFERLVKPSEIADLVYYTACNQVLNGSVIHANLGQIEY